VFGFPLFGSQLKQRQVQRKLQERNPTFRAVFPAVKAWIIMSMNTLLYPPSKVSLQLEA